MSRPSPSRPAVTSRLGCRAAGPNHKNNSTHFGFQRLAYNNNNNDDDKYNKKNCSRRGAEKARATEPFRFTAKERERDKTHNEVSKRHGAAKCSTSVKVKSLFSISTRASIAGSAVRWPQPYCRFRCKASQTDSEPRANLVFRLGCMRPPDTAREASNVKN